MTSARALRRALGTLCGATAALGLGAGPALAGATAVTAVTADPGCSAPSLSQPFAVLGDHHSYTLAPGGAFDDPMGGGWQLSGGARIVQITQPDGTIAGVLDLPSRATAVSPVMCITSDYPTARLWVRNLLGSEGVFFYVSYNVNGVWKSPKEHRPVPRRSRGMDAVQSDERAAQQQRRLAAGPLHLYRGRQQQSLPGQRLLGRPTHARLRPGSRADRIGPLERQLRDASLTAFRFAHSRGTQLADRPALPLAMRLSDRRSAAAERVSLSRGRVCRRGSPLMPIAEDDRLAAAPRPSKLPRPGGCVREG